MDYDIMEIAFSKDEIFQTVYQLKEGIHTIISSKRQYTKTVLFHNRYEILNAKPKHGQLFVEVSELENKSEANYTVELNFFVPCGYKNYRSRQIRFKDFGELERHIFNLVTSLKIEGSDSPILPKVS